MTPSLPPFISLSLSLSLSLSVLFERRRKYNVPVWMCVHPELNQYIKDILVATRTLIRKGEIDKIVLAISNKVKKDIYHVYTIIEHLELLP